MASYAKNKVTSVLVSAKLKDKVILLGRNKKGKNVYSDFLTVEQYYEKTHPWDNADTIIQYKLHKVHGILFNESGTVEHEFETTYNTKTGEYEKAWNRDSKGNVQKHK